MSQAWITGVGARSPQGLSALSVAMAARIEPLVPRATPFVDHEGDVIGAVRARSLPDTLVGPERWVRLAAPALEEALEGHDGPLTLLLALPEAGREDDAPDVGARVLDALAASVDRTLSPASAVVRAGHAGFAIALEAAVTRAAAGQPVVVGGVDSYYHEGVLLALDEACRLHSARAENGFIPGEAAAFACLGGGEARALARPPRGRVVAVASEEEPTVGTDLPNLASAATSVLRRLVTAAGGPLRWVVTDDNGEEHRLAESTKARRRLAAGFADPFELALPSIGGDVGAASGALALTIAVEWWRAGCAPAPRCLVALASDGRARGGFLLEEVG